MQDRPHHPLRHAGFTVALLVGSYFDHPAPLLVLFGQPICFADLQEGISVEAFRVELVQTLVEIGLSQALLYLTSSLFRRIRTSETPFTPEVIKKLKTMGIMLGVIIAVDNGYMGVVIGFVVYAIALIFQYGGELQQQVDETL